MNADAETYAQLVFRALGDVHRAALTLHGRELHNAFGLYGNELQRDILKLAKDGFMDETLGPGRVDLNTVCLVEPSISNARRMKALWDCFMFLCMAHKSQNIVRRAIASGRDPRPILLYLRGADYQLAVGRNGAAVGYTTSDDRIFDHEVLGKLSDDLSVLKVLSPAALTVHMKMLPMFNTAFGPDRGTAAEFARLSNAGVFLSPHDWRERILDLLPSTSAFLVYVTNQSRGLEHELGCLLDRKLEQHTILVLSDERFNSRKTFFELQQALKEGEDTVYDSKDPAACMVEDVAGFEALLTKFPHRLSSGGDPEAMADEIKRRALAVKRSDVSLPADFPFVFEVPLTPEQSRFVQNLHGRVRTFVSEAQASDGFRSFPLLLLHIEIDMYLCLSKGRIVEAAEAAARFAALAGFMHFRLSLTSDVRLSKIGSQLRECQAIAGEIARDAIAMGEWDDYSDRRAYARERVDAIMRETAVFMARMCDAAEHTLVKSAKPDISRVKDEDWSEIWARVNASTEAVGAPSVENG